MPEFKPTAPSAEAVFYRTYSRRKQDGTRESFAEAMTRCVDEIATVGKFDSAEKDLVKSQALQHCFPSGRAFGLQVQNGDAAEKFQRLVQLYFYQHY